MSRITKFLKQTCSYESLKINSKGETILDKYGEPEYESPVLIKCRCEKTIQDVLTNTGAILKTNTRYFTDASYSIKANDKLDGKVVLKVQEYVNQFGLIEGYESYV